MVKIIHSVTASPGKACAGVVAICLVLLAACATPRDAVPGPVGQPVGTWREQIHWVPMNDENGVEHLLYTSICRPLGDAPARVVLLNHGSPPDAYRRPLMHPMSCDSETVRWFLTRGYIVVQGMRLGFGETGGDEAGVGADCTAENYARSGLANARDIDALVAYATALPYARPDGAIVIGVSAGGWASDAYDSLPHPRVVAMISMAGGQGGHSHDVPNNNCRAGELARAAGMFGASATTPMLWIYAANDSFFSPAVASAMYAAFTRAGGKVQFYQLGPFGSDGHFLFTEPDGSAIWEPLVERYLAARDADP